MICAVFGIESYAASLNKVTLHKGQPITEQLNKENTIYKIKYCFDLGGSTVTIPRGSVLKFTAKGELKNGTVIGQETGVATGKKKRFGDKLTVKGSWNVENVYSEWFGVTPDISDNTDRLTAFFNFPGKKKTLKPGVYLVKELQCDGLKNAEIIAYGATLKYLRTDLDHISGDHSVLTNYDNTTSFSSDFRGYVHIFGLTIDGNSHNFIYNPNPKEQTSIIEHHTLRMVLLDELLLKDCTFKNSFMTAVMLDVCKKSEIANCKVINSGESLSYTPVGFWYTWEGVGMMDRLYTSKGWRQENCHECIVHDCYFENIGGSFASANCEVFKCYDNLVVDNRGYAFELSSSYADRLVDIYNNEFRGVGSSVINMTHYEIPDNSINIVKIHNNNFYNVGYDSKRTRSCPKAFLMVYRNKQGEGTGILDVNIKDNYFELASTASQGLIRSDRFVFEGNVCKGYAGAKNEALFFCGNDENTGSYIIRNNTIESESGALSIIRSPQYLEVSGNKVKTSLSPAIVYVQGNDKIKEATFTVRNNEVQGVTAMAYVSSSPKVLEIIDNTSETITVAIVRPTSEVSVNCNFEGNTFKRVSGATKNIRIIKYDK